MPSERIQKRIDAFLDQAEAASDVADWPTVVDRVRAVVGHEYHLCFCSFDLLVNLVLSTGGIVIQTYFGWHTLLSLRLLRIGIYNYNPRV